MAKKKTAPTEKPTSQERLRLEWIEAGTLADNPNNWRRHPKEQTDALGALISDPEIGWAGVLLFNARTNRLVDGHARKAVVDPKTLVPVLIGDWSEAAEARILATLDPLAALAERDDDALRKLVEATDWEGPLAALRDSLKLDPPAAALDASPQLGAYEYKLVIDCQGEQHQAELLKRLEGEGLTVKAMTI